MSVFRTSSGKTIEIDPAHHEFFQGTMERFKSPEMLFSYIKGAGVQFHGGVQNIPETDNTALIDDRRRETMRGYSSRYTAALGLLQALDQAGIPRRFSSMLDIGTGYAVQPRILKGLGVVTDRAVGIDIVERGRNLSSASLAHNHRLFRLYRFLDRYIEKLRQIEDDKLSDFQRTMLLKVSSPRHRHHVATGQLLSPDIYTKYKYVTEPKLDEYIVGDVFAHNGKYDLITIFSSIIWFDGKKLMEKISSLLNPGGVFYFYGPSWWAGNNCCKIGGHFPYVRQTLTPEDYKRYVSEYFPGSVDARVAAYEYADRTHPTLVNYLDHALAAGMVPAGIHYGVPPEKYSQKYGIQPLGYAVDDFGGFLGALNLIREQRPDVLINDMLATVISAVLVKPHPVQDRSAQLRSARDRLNKRYEPTNPILRLLKNSGLRI